MRYLSDPQRYNTKRPDNARYRASIQTVGNWDTFYNSLGGRQGSFAFLDSMDRGSWDPVFAFVGTKLAALCTYVAEGVGGLLVAVWYTVVAGEFDVA